MQKEWQVQNALRWKKNQFLMLKRLILYRTNTALVIVSFWGAYAYICGKQKKPPLMLVRVDHNPTPHSLTQGWQRQSKRTSSLIPCKTSDIWKEIRTREDSQGRAIPIWKHCFWDHIHALSEASGEGVFFKGYKTDWVRSYLYKNMYFDMLMVGITLKM